MVYADCKLQGRFLKRPGKKNMLETRSNNSVDTIYQWCIYVSFFESTEDSLSRYLYVNWILRVTKYRAMVIIDPKLSWNLIRHDKNTARTGISLCLFNRQNIYVSREIDKSCLIVKSAVILVPCRMMYIIQDYAECFW